MNWINFTKTFYLFSEPMSGAVNKDSGVPARENTMVGSWTLWTSSARNNRADCTDGMESIAGE